MRRRESIGKLQGLESSMLSTVLIVFLMVIWQLVVDRGLIKRYTLPSPVDVARTLVQIIPDIREHLFVTLKETFVGFSMAIILAILLALAMDNIALLKKALYPLLVVSQTVPIILLAPLFALWFGFGELPRIMVVMLVCFFPIVISLLDGFNSVDPDMVNLFRSMGATKIQIFRLLKFPASMSSFFSGLRISATYSIMAAVIGEWMGGSKGLGVYMLRVKQSFAMDKVFSVILLIVVSSIAVFKIISIVQGIAMPWHRLMRKQKTGGL